MKIQNKPANSCTTRYVKIGNKQKKPLEID